MNKIQLVFYFLLWLPSLLSAKDSWLDVSPENRFVQYSGRIDFADAEKPKFCYPGVSITIAYEGSTAEVFLNELGQGEENSTNYFQVLLDDSLYKIWKLIPGKNKLQISTQKGKHVLKIFKRTECSVGSCEFLGMQLLQPASLLKAPSKHVLLEFIGDSYTCGYGNELSIPAPPSGNPNTGFHSVNENNYMAWGAIASRSLNADYQTIAYSGRGMYRNNTGSKEGTIPELYFNESLLIADENKTDLKHPDFIIIHLGTNDFFPESNGDMVDSLAFTKAYLKFLKKLKNHHATCKIICVMSNGISDWWPEKTKSRTRCSNMIKSVVNTMKDPSVFYLDIGIQTAPYGEDWHPSIATHQVMAEKLVAFIKSIQ
jgi:lysophospholipase L1-like esterase